MNIYSVLIIKKSDSNESLFYNLNELKLIFFCWRNKPVILTINVLKYP